ncbi:hypothetical protein SAMN04488074_11986 [Lentzea albidocapillata subsp. violacea]|uniref:(2Fe-2S) ferredoxin n=1 Tax=Lentzea albidocapillata subsp. violacea TaxID=128104 RepID=A0A1G9S1D7_9PSEU|nr:hypothetical protein [Lentzea albidocapillata]SDM29080.1 hypothetical protein SAMN04488074_11986 [Lentzea albidocapillata subsp. violacea]
MEGEQPPPLRSANRGLREGAGAGNVRVADCLDSCDYSNVVVVRPAPAVRARGTRPVWFGGVLTEEATQDILAWVAAGGPGQADMPDGLADRMIDQKTLPAVDEVAAGGGDRVVPLGVFADRLRQPTMP